MSCRADDDVDGWRLTGVKRAVPDLAAATTAVVVAREHDRVNLFRVDLADHPETVHPLSTEDRTRRLGELRLDGTPAERLERRRRRGAARVRRTALALLACEADRGDPAGARPRRGAREDPDPVRPADRLVPGGLAPAGQRLHRARAGPLAGLPGGLVRGRGRPGAGRGGRSAAVAAARAAVGGCEDAIQAMGGIGFTWDHPLHRYYKRAQWIASFDGSPGAAPGRAGGPGPDG